jgi:signal transduction histidine kinase
MLMDTDGTQIPPRDLPLTRSALDGEVILNKDMIILNSDGSKKYIMANTSPVKDSAGNISGAIGIFQDVTEQKIAREKQRDQQTYAYAKDILETIEIPVLLLDANFYVELANPSYYRFFLQSKAVTIGSHFSELEKAMWNTPELMDQLKKVLHTKRSMTGYLLDCHHDKLGRIVLRVNAHMIEGTGSVEDKIVVTVEDITEEKLAEEEERKYRQLLRSMSAQLTNTEEKERQRIAGGLHDNVLQSLTATRIKLSLVQQDVASEPALDQIKEVDEVITRALENIRELSFELSSPHLQTEGFVEAIEWFAEKFDKKNKIPVSIKLRGQPKPLDQYLKIVLFQSVRELLNNVVKHAKADQVTIAVHFQEEKIVIELRDNGVGFDTSQLFSAIGESKGFGLFNIRERLDFLGGSLELESKVGKGTKVVLTAPLKK